MDPSQTPNSINNLLAALADGEIDLRDQPDALARLAQDPRACQRVACQQQLKRAVGQAMTGPRLCCPDQLAAQLKAIAAGDPGAASTTTPPMPANAEPAAPPRPATNQKSPVLARIGRWAPSAVAAVLLLAAGVLFTQSNAASTRNGPDTFLTTSQVRNFSGRHNTCATKLESLHDTKLFGEKAEFDQLPGRLGNYFKTSTDGMRLNLGGIGYDYQLTGVCSVPGGSSVHIVYRHHDNPDRAISVWIRPAGEAHDQLQPDRVYVEAGNTLDHPVIFWRSEGLLYYLVGDSLQDCHDAVETLRQPI